MGTATVTVVRAATELDELEATLAQLPDAAEAYALGSQVAIEVYLERQDLERRIGVLRARRDGHPSVA